MTYGRRESDRQGVYVYPEWYDAWFFPTGPYQWTTHTWAVILPPGSAPGAWGLAELTVWDRAGNFRLYDFTEIIHFVVEGD